MYLIMKILYIIFIIIVGDTKVCMWIDDDSTHLTEINSKEENSFRFSEESLNKIYLRGKSSKKNVYNIQLGMGGTMKYEEEKMIFFSIILPRLLLLYSTGTLCCLLSGSPISCRTAISSTQFQRCSLSTTSVG